LFQTWFEKGGETREKILKKVKGIELLVRKR
jgi:hypothetical protein